MVHRRGWVMAAGLCLAAITGCATQPDITDPAQVPPATASTTAEPAKETKAADDLRGRVTFTLTTEDSYQGTVTLTAYEPVAFGVYPGSGALAECSPTPNPTRTAVARIDFAFRDQSPPEFPWKLGWGADGLGPSRVLAHRSGPAEPFGCSRPASWSGAGTMSVLLAIDEHFSPRTPKGKPEQLARSGAEFPLVGDAARADIRIAARSGNVRGDVDSTFFPALRIALTAQE